MSTTLKIGKAAGEPIRFSKNHPLPAHLRVRVEDGGHGMIVVMPDALAHAHVIEVDVGVRATCVCVVLSTGAISMTQRGTVAEGGKLHWQNATLGAGTVTHDLTTTLTGESATGSVDWLAYCASAARYDLSAKNIFAAREGGGEITMKGVAGVSGQLKLAGSIDILSGGGGTNTYLTQQALMLDPTAKVDAIPALEIKTDDVKASHSATVSRITPADLFYVSSRGIPVEEARQLFIRGFVGDILERFADVDIRKAVEAAII